MRSKAYWRSSRLMRNSDWVLRRWPRTSGKASLIHSIPGLWVELSNGNTRTVCVPGAAWPRAMAGSRKRSARRVQCRYGFKVPPLYRVSGASAHGARPPKLFCSFTELAGKLDLLENGAGGLGGIAGGGDRPADHQVIGAGS